MDIDATLKASEVEALTKENEKCCTEHVKYTYKIINEVFSKHIDKKLRQQCMSDGTFTKFLDRLAMLTGEKKRQKVTESRELKVPEVTVNYSSPVSSAQKKKENVTQVK
jgi:hypothetical protein